MTVFTMLEERLNNLELQLCTMEGKSLALVACQPPIHDEFISSFSCESSKVLIR